MTAQHDNYKSGLKPTWCDGCSYFTIMSALTGCFSDHNIDPCKINVISGIGCSSRLPFFLNTFGMHTLHGRPLPVAIGARLANPGIPVIVTAGDGDLFSIGANHFIHAAHKNFDITVICFNNRTYAMTKNQASPTSPAGFTGSLSPYGKPEAALNTIELAISGGATMVSRTCAYDKSHMKKIVSDAFCHRGFSFVDVIAPCRTFGQRQKEILTRLEDLQLKNHPMSNREKALAEASKIYESDSNPKAPILVGTFWKKDALCFEEQIRQIRNNCKDSPKSMDEILDKYQV
ncbi:MAG: hypothetical protein LBI42_12590 [Chitinispirillales bacterium]|jgi:2-oxoglutarate ferredoxin oxidoreductase subunit beta|nr:hypothetical protein [Chitinispirillales bacterium]